MSTSSIQIVSEPRPIQSGVHHVNTLDRCNIGPWEIGYCIELNIFWALYSLVPYNFSFEQFTVLNVLFSFHSESLEALLHDKRAGSTASGRVGDFNSSS